MTKIQPRASRRGSVYLAVLGTALIVSLLAFSALALQRVQNRMLTKSIDVRQAQLYAEAAIELGLLAIKNDPNWRTTYPSGTWFSNRNIDEGGCTLLVVDPIDADLDDNTSDPIMMTGIGKSGTAVQRVVQTFDSNAEYLECLRSSVAAGGNVSLTGAVLRATTSGLISADSTSASSSTIYGKVQAVSISGTTYSGTTTQIAAADRPDMPNWQTVFDHYRTNGTEINYNSLPATSTINLVMNNSFTTTTSYWTGDAPDWTNDVPTGSSTLPDATLSRTTNFAGHAACVNVARSSRRAGPLQYVDVVLRPNATYSLAAEIYFSGSFASNAFRFGLYLQFADGTAVAVRSTPVVLVNSWTPDWHTLSTTLTVPNWTSELRSAFVIVNSDDTLGSSNDFYFDNLEMDEASATGRCIFRNAFGPGLNPFGASPNGQGLYWIDCSNNKLVISHARIRGTLLVVNPGAGSSIGPGPIRWEPAVVGYPALMVDATTAANADFTIAATNRSLNETENGVSFNPTGAPSDEFGQDTDWLDVFPSEIQGPVVVEDDLTFQNNALVRGQVIVGDAISATSGALEVVYRPDALFNPPPGFTATPSQVGRPLSVRKAVSP